MQSGCRPHSQWRLVHRKKWLPGKSHQILGRGEGKESSTCLNLRKGGEACAWGKGTVEGPGSLEREQDLHLALASCEPWVKLSALAWNGT